MPKVIKTDVQHREIVSAFERSTLDPENANAFRNPEGEAAQIVARAREEAEVIAQEAYEEGLRRGIEEGERKFLETVAGSAEALRSAAHRIEQSHEEFMDEIEPQLVRLAASIASKIIERESSLSADLVRRTVRSALEKVIDEEQVVLKVNPKDLEILRAHRAELMEEFDAIKRIDLVADEGIDAGGCIAQTASVRIDARLASQLEKILNELLG
jgi:flagellar assembly protein FliH